MRVIVPQQAAVPGGLVGRERRKDERDQEPPGSIVMGAVRGAGRADEWLGAKTSERS